MTEKEFVRRAEAMQSRLYRMAYVYFASESIAKDVLDETIYRALKGYRKLKKEDVFEGWLTRILLNECHREWNYQKKKMSLEDVPLEQQSEEDAFAQLPLKLAIAIVVAAILYRILHIFMVDILWNPNEYWGGKKLTVERQGREDALFSAWALWEQDQTVRWFFVGDIYPGPHYHYMETEEIAFDGVEMEDSFRRFREDVLFLDGSVLWMDVDEDVNEITVRIKNDTFTIHLDEVRP